MITESQKVIGLSYVLHTQDGEFIEATEINEPLEVLLGSNSIIPGLEKELIGLSVGDKKVINIDAKDAYGEDDPELRLIVSRSEFPEDVELEPGFEFMSADEEGNEQLFVVVEIEGDDVKVDGNHPLAGAALSFDIEVVSMREPTADEIAHGHVHSEDCHH